jgi:hypothetical protein
MNAQRKYIAIFLLWVFILPISFQPLHVIWHHSQEHHLTHHYLKKSNETFSTKEKHCPICDFKLLINCELKNYTFIFNVPAISCSYVKLEINNYFKEVFSYKTPRAPPFS